MRHTPSLPEIVRADTADLKSTIAHLVSCLEPSGGGFNYLDATKRVLVAYKGLHSTKALLADVPTKQDRFGHKYNMDVVRLAAPVAYGRKTRVFQLPARKLPYGDQRLASYRLPFFFVENGVYKAYFLQPRKNTHFTREQFALLATVVKKNLLENEFFGERFDIELVDVSERAEGAGRSMNRFSLADFPEVSDGAVERHFSMINEALGVIENEAMVSKVRRPLRDSQFTLFD